MYPNNIYIKNHDEIEKITMDGGKEPDISVKLNIFDEQHGLKRDNLARAQYKHWLSIKTGASSLLTPDDLRLLDME